jgi:regulator of replication initiation timing
MDEGINSMVETIKELEAENEKLKFRLSNVSGSYVVFEDSQEQEGLVQLSVTLPTLERAREYVKAWKSKRLYIYLLVE